MAATVLVVMAMKVGGRKLGKMQRFEIRDVTHDFRGYNKFAILKKWSPTTTSSSCRRGGPKKLFDVAVFWHLDTFFENKFVAKVATSCSCHDHHAKFNESHLEESFCTSSYATSTRAIWCVCFFVHQITRFQI